MLRENTHIGRLLKMVFRILGTVFVGLSFVTMFVKNTFVFSDSKNPIAYILTMLYSVAWRALVIVALWII